MTPVLTFTFMITPLLYGCAKEKLPPNNEIPAKGQVSSPSDETAKSPNDHSSENQASPDCSIQFKKSKLCLTWAWEKKPTETDQGVFTFTTFKINSEDQSMIISDLSSIPKVILWMPAMGHGSSPTKVEQLGQGSYRVSNVYFLMPGEWQFRFKVVEEKSTLDEAVANLTF